MKKTLIITILFLLVTPFFINAQSWKKDRREIFFMGGMTGFMGELGGANQAGKSYHPQDFDMEATNVVGGLGYLYRTSDVTSVKTGFYFGRVEGDDANTEDPVRNNRNLSFRSFVIELSSQFELTVFSKRKGGHRYKYKGIRGRSHLDYTVYIFGGVGGFYFNPMAKVPDYINGGGGWFPLRKMGAEGQGFLNTREYYSNFQLCFPYGGGMKFSLGRDFYVGIEYGYRKTFTDYIDNVSKTYYDVDKIRYANVDGLGDVAAYLCDPSIANDVNHLEHSTKTFTNEFGEEFPITDLANATKAGQQRGDPREKDTYMFAVVTFYYKLKRSAFAIPKF